MGLSRQTRIITLLVIDTFFLLLELTVGYAVHSLALVADAFHMLNDVLSLVVALYTIKLATSPSSASNSYGWQRAEILGALINGVFLIALCVSIFLEAIGRIFDPPEITNPKLIVAVGSAGLVSNIVGLVLFHEHGHGHGHSHSHSHGEIALDVERDEPLQPGRPAAQTIPKRSDSSDSVSSLYQHPAETRAQIIEAARLGQSIENEDFLSSSPTARVATQSRRRLSPVDIKVPAVGSNETLPPQKRPSQSHSHSHSRDHVHTISNSTTTDNTAVAADDGDQVLTPRHVKPSPSDLENGFGATSGHSHGGHGHSHGSMNMRGVFLHVVGDALGNVGVISAGLVIWFCEGRWTLYFDPAVSLLITCIIFSSAMPLVKSASKILLQAVPQHVSLDDLRDQVKSVEGVVSVHELHVWQLSETTSVASVHVLILPQYDYMPVANEVRRIMHAAGIHSVTIQPEFTDDPNESDDGADAGERSCLIRCPPDQCVADTCCPPPKSPSRTSTQVSPAATPQLSHASGSEAGEAGSH